MPSVLRVASVCVAGLCSLAACGGSGGNATDSAKRFSGEEREVAQLVEDFEDATADGDIERVCTRILSQRVVRDAERSGRRCRDEAGELQAVAARYGGREELDVDTLSVQISGRTARARIRYSGAGQSRTERIALVEEGGRWAVGVRGGGGRRH